MRGLGRQSWLRHPAEDQRHDYCLAITPAAEPHPARIAGVTHINRRHSAIRIAAVVVSGSRGGSRSAAFVTGVTAPVPHRVASGHNLRDPLRRAGAMPRRDGWRRVRIRPAATAPEATGLGRIGNQEHHSTSQQKDNPFHSFDSIWENKPRQSVFLSRGYMALSFANVCRHAHR